MENSQIGDDKLIDDNLHNLEAFLLYIQLKYTYICIVLGNSTIARDLWS